MGNAQSDPTFLDLPICAPVSTNKSVVVKSGTNVSKMTFEEGTCAQTLTCLKKFNLPVNSGALIVLSLDQEWRFIDCMYSFRKPQLPSIIPPSMYPKKCCGDNCDALCPNGHSHSDDCYAAAQRNTGKVLTHACNSSSVAPGSSRPSVNKIKFIDMEVEKDKFIHEFTVLPGTPDMRTYLHTYQIDGKLYCFAGEEDKAIIFLNDFDEVIFVVKTDGTNKLGLASGSEYNLTSLGIPQNELDYWTSAIKNKK